MPNVEFAASEIPEQVIVDLATGETLIVPLTAEELAQRSIDAANAASAVDIARSAALDALRARRDRYLAQTDMFVLPLDALPVDLPAATRDAIVANRDAWVAWRQKLRDYPATVADPLSPPPFPAQPETPDLRLT